MLRRVLSRAASEFDRAVTNVVTGANHSRIHSTAESLGHEDRMRWLSRVEEIYGSAAFIAEPDRFFVPVGPLDARQHVVRSYPPGGRVVDLSWASRSQPFCADIAPAYLASRANHTSTARLFLHNDRARPLVILIHGYRGGAFALEERVWPLRWLFDCGLDLALAVLPLHGVRSDPARRGPPAFPGADPRITIEGFRQSIIDMRDLVKLMRERGAPHIAVMGMSLGGYTTALLATLEPQLALAVPMIPLASIADFARDQGRLVGDAAQQMAQFRALDRAHQVVSPLARPSKLPRDRVLVLAADGDRITPIDHAKRVAKHFDAPLETFVGGHLLQFGRGDAFRAVGRTLGRLGLLEPR